MSTTLKYAAVSGLLVAGLVFSAMPSGAVVPTKTASTTPGASAAVQKEFDAFITKFRVALKANDTVAVTSMTKHPFETGDYANATQFRTKGYPKIFTPKNRVCIERTKGVYERAPNSDEYYSVPCGGLFFVFTKTKAGFLFTYMSDND